MVLARGFAQAFVVLFIRIPGEQGGEFEKGRGNRDARDNIETRGDEEWTVEWKHLHFAGFISG